MLWQQLVGGCRYCHRRCMLAWPFQWRSTLPKNDNDRTNSIITNHPPFLSRQFSTLSQGQQQKVFSLRQCPTTISPGVGQTLSRTWFVESWTFTGPCGEYLLHYRYDFAAWTHHVEQLIPSIGHSLCLWRMVKWVLVDRDSIKEMSGKSKLSETI